MPSITLKNVPVALLARLREAAARERRSLNQEALVLLEDGLVAKEGAEERARRQVEAWRQLAGRWVEARPFEEEGEDLLNARSPGRNVAL